MTKKVLFGCAAVLLALAGRAWLHLDSSPSEAEVALAPAAESPSSARAPGHRLSASVPAPSAQADRTAAAEPPSTQLGVPGRVFDAETGEPLAGVLVKAFAPEELLYSELKKRASPYLAQSPWNGEVRAFATWPRLDAELTEAQRLDVDPVVAWTRPEQGQVALATAISDAAGRFQLSVPPGGATLVCELAGYGPRCLPLTSSDLKALDANAGIVLAMRTPGRLSGQVIDVQGRPVDEELELVFWGAVQGTDDQGAELHHDSSTESWSASTAPDGSFDLHLPSATVSARARTPGYLVRQTGFHPDHQQPWVFDTVFEPGRPNACPFGLDHSPYIVVERVPVLHVTDASSGVGVEHVQMIGRELANGRVYSAGRYFAPGGQLPLIDDSRRNSEVAEMDLELLIWAPGYRASRVRLFADVLKQQAVPVALEPGELPALAGRVLAAGQPLEGVKVALQPYGKSPWRIEDGGAAQVVRTDASGSFALRAPAGAYVLRLEAGTRLFAEPLSLPAGAERVIDFASLGQVHVEVRDDSGGLQAEHTVILRDGSGRSQVQTTNERGETTFEHLPNGAYQLYAPRVATQGSFSRGIENAVEVRGAGVARVVISLPTLGEPRHAYLETDTGEDLHGWSARTPAAFDAVPIELDGRIRIDLARQNFRDVTIVAPDGRQWVVTLPEDPPDGHRIRLALEGPRYVGRLVNDATGTPLKGVRVSASAAQPQSRDDGNIARPSTITDRDGRFVISCEHAVAHKLHFETDSQGKATNHLEGIVFHLVREPSRQPIEFTLRLPYRREGSFQGLAQKRLGGRVQQQDTGAPVADARVWVSSRESRPSGILEIHGATVTTDAAGRYELSVVDLPSYRLSVFPPNSSSARVIEEWEGTRGVDERRDPSIP